MKQRTILRKVLTCFIIIVFIFTSIPAISQDTLTCPSNTRNNTLSAQTLYVDNNNTMGPWDGTLEHPYQHINDATRNASTGDTVFVFNGTYNEQVYMEISVQLIGENKNSTIIDGGGTKGSTVVCHANDITVSGFTIRQCGDWANDAGVWITDAWDHHSSHNTITGNIICNNNNDAVMLYQSSYNTITNNIIADNHGGINVGSSSGYNIFSGNTLINNSIGIWGIPTYTRISNNTVKAGTISLEGGYDNTIRDNMISNSNGIALTSTGSTVLQGNHLFHSKGLEIAGLDWSSSSILGNTIDGKPIYAWYLQFDTVIPGDAAQVILANCYGVTVENLTMTDTYGIQLFSSQGTRILNNRLIGTDGIQLTSSTNNIISNNHITNSHVSIYLDESANNSVETNEIRNDWGAANSGIMCKSSSYNNLSGNIITNCSWYGIQILGGPRNFISSNYFQNNKVALMLTSTHDNIIHANNFIKSREAQATFSADDIRLCHNTWTNNYWDNHLPIGPKIIFGMYNTHIKIVPYPRVVTYIYFPGFNIDLHPARRPYDI